VSHRLARTYRLIRRYDCRPGQVSCEAAPTPRTWLLNASRITVLNHRVFKNNSFVGRRISLNPPRQGKGLQTRDWPRFWAGSMAVTAPKTMPQT